MDMYLYLYFSLHTELIYKWGVLGSRDGADV